jgi:Alginate lyase
LRSCVATPFVAAPVGRMNIPHHYLSGSNGPINPAEAVATHVYQMFEKRITAGMNQYLATGSHAESACALAQLDGWAQAHALLDYDRQESTQAWYQVEWTLSSAGITASVLVNDSTLDPIQKKRVIAWLDDAAHKDLSFEKPGDTNNNHHYWRALAATAVGVTASDNALFSFGIKTYQEAIAEIDANGAFPKEMARHENATHYQGFALEPLILIARALIYTVTRFTVIPFGTQSFSSAGRWTIPPSSSLIRSTLKPATSGLATLRHSPSTPPGLAPAAFHRPSSTRLKIQPKTRGLAAVLPSWRLGRHCCTLCLFTFHHLRDWPQSAAAWARWQTPRQ